MEYLIKQPESFEVVKGSEHSTIYVTISEDEYESLIRTIEFLSNPELQKRFK